MKQQLLTLIVGFLTVFQANSIMPKFTYEYEGKTLTYRITNMEEKTCKVVKSNFWIEGDVKIPAKVIYDDEEYTVNVIDKRAFYQSNIITTITIPETVTSIGTEAFLCSYHLTSITLPASVTEIGENVFAYCKNLSSVVLSESLPKIPDGTFSHCSLLSSLSIPESVTEIGDEAFMGCTALTNISLPESITKIGDKTFYNCSGLKEITLSKELTEIGSYAFQSCTGITQLIIPPLVTSIGKYAFRDCKFAKVASPTTLYYYISPYDVKYAPEGVIIEDGYIYGPDKSSILYVPIEIEGEFIIPDYITKIGSGAFLSCKGITNIIIPEAVTEIGDRAFSNCTNLTSIILPESINKISYHLFYECFNLKSITIPKSVTEIEDGAFWDCNQLAEIIIPPSVTYIGAYAFYNCNMKVAYPLNCNISPSSDFGPFSSPIGYNPKKAIIEDNVIYGEGKSSIIYVSIFHKGEFIIPETVVKIEEDAFEYCGKITNIIFPESVTEIEPYAFNHCSGLTNLTLPSSLTEIGYDAFSGCSGLTDIIIPNSVIDIGSFAFYDCKNLRSATIPESVKYMSYDIFWHCDNLREINYPAAEPIHFNNYIFDDDIFTNVTLYVRPEAYEKIMQCDPWRNFKRIEFKDFDTSVGQIIEETEQGIIDYTLPMEVYSLHGQYLASSLQNLAKGIYIVRQGHVVKKIQVN